jgi:uncharacterized protein YndB with AHSA1/START domain
MAGEPGARVDSASRLVHAAPKTVYAAFLDPAALAVWLPPEDMTGDVIAFEPRAGGRFRLVLTYSDGGHSSGKTTDDSDVVEGRIAELAPDERVAWLVDFESDDPTLAGTMTMTWTLTPRDGATEVTVTAENVPAGIRPEDHAAGMSSTLANLAKYVEQSPG